MVLYIGTCLLSMFISWCVSVLRYKQKEIKKSIKVIGTILPMILVSGLRYGIGSDYFFYNMLFDREYFSSNSYKGPIYFDLYTHFIKLLGGDYTTLVFVTSAIFFFLIFYRVFDDSPYPWLSVFFMFGMLYFFISMNAMRQTLAMAFLVYSLKYIVSEEKCFFYSCLVIAIGIHPVSIIFLTVVFLYKIEINKKNICFFMLLAFGLISASSTLISISLELTESQDYQIVTQNVGTTWIVNFLFQIIVMISSYYIYQRKMFQTKNEYYMFKAYLCTQIMAVCCYFLVVIINMSEVYRFAWIFNIFDIIIVPILISKIRDKYLRIIISGILIVLFSINVYVNIVMINMHQTLPYISVFDYF